eukprot:CAMPEP_0170212460 /NCGR_PEP_ID=MMETSP0116_2-20130129/5848_1 /TAXON_ID=400756 /ORGANISM="Durinskia baltica, Strain CSIRO CS-38" /LENGTH=33 /DNA_ID= /DNA_START= /DNA_END= /DNA_ORIENTATION=
MTGHSTFNGCTSGATVLGEKVFSQPVLRSHLSR